MRSSFVTPQSQDAGDGAHTFTGQPESPALENASAPISSTVKQQIPKKD